MSAAIDLTEAQCMQALGDFIESLVDPDVEVVRSQTNRVPEPMGSSFILMTEIGRVRLETNVDSYDDGAFNVPPTPGLLNMMQPTQFTIQIDAHGPRAAESIQIFSTVFRSGYACDLFAATGFDVTPLYTGEPHQAPYTNAEQQVEPRWTVDAVLQINPNVSLPQDFADTLAVGLIDVDVVYPAT